MNAKFFKKYQLETYALIVFPILWITISGFFERPLFFLITADRQELWSRSLFFGGDMLKFSFIVIYFYLYFKLFIWLGQFIRIKVFKEQIPNATDMKRFLSSFAYMTLAIFCSSLLLIYTVRQSSMLVSTPKIIASSELYMKMDFALFHHDPRIWLVDQFSNTSWDFWITFIYRKLNWAFAAVLVALVLFKKTLFRKYLFAFFLAPMLALPFWLAAPAVTPNEMYRINRYTVASANQYQQDYENMPAGYHLNRFLNFVDKRIESPFQKYPIISTNPSMHVAWGFIIGYYAILLWRPLAFFFVPWFLFIMLSTLYTFQHYFIDLPGGILCAMLTIMLTNYFFKIEKKYYTGNYNALYFLDVFQEDAMKCLRFLLRFKKKPAMDLGSAKVD